MDTPPRPWTDGTGRTRWQPRCGRHYLAHDRVWPDTVWCGPDHQLRPVLRRSRWVAYLRGQVRANRLARTFHRPR